MLEEKRHPRNRWPAQIDRFMASTKEAENGCLEWTGTQTKNGYGFFQFNGTATTAHRWHYQHAHGVKLPRDIDVRHKCHNRLCVQLDHLEPGTRGQNMFDAILAGRLKFERPWLKGERHPGAVLSAEDVTEIRALSQFGFTQSAIATQFPVSVQQVHRIVHGLSHRETENVPLA